ncbi:MAG: CBS domain-containing protein [Nitrospinae bacterium]|nr:CBS domain-containing protein [Nitrospinota bacterium]MBL7020523.1 CBS domain-containing protein [Nitrospinaceae bacterium]
MQVITTHLNADFDCLASMMAAKKLYPEAHLVLPGSAERLVEDFLKEEGPLLEFTRIKDIPLDQVRLLVVVDTHAPERIGIFAPLMDNPSVEVHIYDHHPEPEIKTGQVVIKKRGAATTIFYEILLEKKVPLTPEECTLMVLGIYQDTHSLITVSTTPEDLMAAGDLIKRGADLSRVSSYMRQRLNPDQLDIFNELVSGLESHMVNGVEVTLVTASSDHFIRDLAYVVQNVMDMENLAAVFALVRLDKRIYLIARSSIAEVNVAELAQVFGGGGHESAASATIKELTLVQVKEKLLGELERLVQPLSRIRDIMHAPAISVDVSDTIEGVEKKLTLYNLNTLPVLSDKQPVGLITRQIVEKAIHHGMGKDCVEELMISRFAVTSPDAYFKSVIALVIEEKQKLIPVVDPENMLIGVVSRGDLLRVLHNDMAQQAEPSKVLFQGKVGTPKSMKSLIKERLDKDVFRHLDSIAQIGDRLSVSVYAVGGFVRDLLLNIPNQDIDIVVEGEGIPFAVCLAEEFGGRVTSHEKFGTSVVIFSDGYRIDVATARMEYYKHPGALPTVEKSSIKSDLFRRDFTVNSMAVKLTGANAFCLIDFFNGERDLRSREIHVLHSLSFIEDPCRLFRAIRFEQRFGFAMGKQAEAFMRSTIKKRLVDSLSGTRLFNEIKLLLNEKCPMDCVRRMQEFDLFQFVSPEMLKAPQDLEVLERLESVLSWAERVIVTEKPEVWYVYFLGLFYSLDEEAFLKAADRLHLPSRMKNSLCEDRTHCRESLKQLRSQKEWGPKEIYHTFARLSVEAVVLLMALSSTDRLNQYANIYFTQYQGKAEPALTGDDLVDMGLEPGPVFQSVLNALREARVMGRVSSREEEVTLVEERFLKS